MTAHARVFASVIVLIACVACACAPARASAGAAASPAALTSPASTPDPLTAVLAAFTPENRRYARVREVTALLEPVWAVIVAFGLVATGVAARLRDFAHRRVRGRYARTLLFMALAGAVALAFTLPLDAFRDWWWERRYGLSNQAFAAWLGEQATAYAIELAFLGGTGVVALAQWGIAAAGRRAWLWLACGALPVMVAAVLLQPLVFEPAFNRFRPLGDAALARRIVTLAERAGIPARKVLVADRSKQTRTVNAYVSGFGPTQRIVFWDTILARLDGDELAFVAGHEIGHYRLGHIWQGVVLGWLASFALFGAGAAILRALLARYGARWRITSLDDTAALPLAVGVLGALLIAFQPAANAWSRRIEHQADAFGLELTHLNAAAARTFVDFAAHDRDDPDPPALLRLMLWTHDPLVARVRFAIVYRPWERGAPNRYAPAGATSGRARRASPGA